MINYLFYSLSKLKIYKPIYWAKIFVVLIIAISFLPAALAVLGHFLSFYDQGKIEVVIKLIILGLATVASVISNSYYSPDRIRKLNAKYSGEPRWHRNLKLTFVFLFLLGILLFGGTAVRYLVTMVA